MERRDPEIQIQCFLPIPNRALLATLAILLGSAALLSVL